MTHSSLTSLLLDGRYRLGSPLACGGSGLVHAAEDVEFGRPVAVKLVRSADDPRAAERLYREACAAARTLHPAVVIVYAYGSIPELDLSYLVMERLFGEDLAARLGRAGALPLASAQRIALEISDLLVTVHEAGIVHRDIKPANVYLGRRGMHVDEVRVLDFGIARSLDLSTLTVPGEVLGTFGYMAPEQMMGEPIDARCDIYALGMVLFEMLTGQLPFTGKRAPELLRSMLKGGACRLAQWRPDLPSPVADLVARCTAAARDARFSTSRDLRSALQALSPLCGA